MSETPVSEARPYTEKSALGEILKWSRQRPAWMRDALRRLMVGGELSDQDIDELEAICLGDDGEGSPLSDAHIAPRRLVGMSGHQIGRERSRGLSRSIAGLSMAGAGSLDIHKSNWLWTGFGRGTFAARVHTHLEIVHDGAAVADRHGRDFGVSARYKRPFVADVSRLGDDFVRLSPAGHKRRLAASTWRSVGPFRSNLC